MEEIYYKGIIAGVTYCIAVWGTTTVANFNQLEELHLKAARFIHKIPCTVPKHEVLGIANWKSLLYIYKRRLAAIMYQAHNDQLPEKFNELFEDQKNKKRYNLRCKHAIDTPRPNTEFGRLSVRFRGPIVWNALPTEVKEAPSHDAFKARLKTAKSQLETIQFQKGSCNITARDKDFIYF